MAAYDDGFAFQVLRWERAGKFGKFVVGFDEALPQLFHQSVVTHVCCARELVTSLQHRLRDTSDLRWVGGVSLRDALEILGDGGLNSSFAKSLLRLIQHFGGSTVVLMVMFCER